jgi:hypothetical protein
MGDRVSIQFQNGDKKSVVLFSHWGGKEFPKEAKKYVKQLPSGLHTTPLDRKEPNTVMVDFIRYITKDIDRVDSNLYLGLDGLYLGLDENDGDNSDNGHFLIKL